MDQVSKQRSGIIFLDDSGGTGNTFLINLILAEIRAQGEIALAIATSGIAATLMEGGRQPIPYLVYRLTSTGRKILPAKKQSLTCPSEKLVETVGTTETLMESMMVEVAHLTREWSDPTYRNLP
jgi:hypothetical protein